jgi:DNA-binding NtrC family response regulator
VSVACEGLTPSGAEQALFGDEETVGQVAAAHGGTLFLDGIAALPLEIQARLCRVIGTGQLDGVHGVSRPVSFRLCSSSRFASGQLLERKAVVSELLHGRVSIHLPPLCQRIEEIPSIIARTLRGLSPARPAHASLVEACMVRPWPGNVRELLMEVRNAAAVSVEANARDVRAAHLSVAAGMPLNNPDRFETLEESPEAIARSMRGAGASGSSGGRP